jgi:uncharacterized protein YecT (DUF1311 family)
MFFLAMALATTEPALDCSNQVTQVDMNQCAHIEYKRADAELNRQWKLALAAAKTADREMAVQTRNRGKGYVESLMAAQRAWLVYRDNHCLLNSSGAIGGSMEPMLYSFCLRALTEARTEQLQIIAEGH